MKKILITGLVLAALTGCNTVAGVGQDVSSGAQTVQGWFGGN